MQIVDSAVPTQMFPALTPLQQRAVEAAVADTGITKTSPRIANDSVTGELVFYVLPNGFSQGQRRPAIIVRDWKNGIMNLQVFTDGLNDFAAGDEGSDGILWATSVHYAPGISKAPGTWHYKTENF